MATSTLPNMREKIFRQGLKNATGSVTWIFPRKPEEGVVRLDGPVVIEFHFHRQEFPASQHNKIGVGSRVTFDMGAAQRDDEKVRPKMTLPRLILPDENETNFNR